MIQTATHRIMHAVPREVPRTAADHARYLDSLRHEAAREVAGLFDGISGKRINAALVPGVTRHSVSRAMNGCESNPLARLPGWFVLCRRLGVPKARLQRVLNWLQAALDAAYEDEAGPSLAEVMEEEQERDSAEDPVQMKAALGCRESLQTWLDRVLDRHAYDRTVIATVSAELWLPNRTR